MIKPKEATIQELMASYAEVATEEALTQARERVEFWFKDPDVRGVVMFQNLDMCSSNLGEATIVVVGKHRTLSKFEDADGKHLGDVPSRFQWPTLFARKPDDEEDES